MYLPKMKNFNYNKDGGIDTSGLFSPAAPVPGYVFTKNYPFETQTGLLVALEPPTTKMILGKCTVMTIAIEVMKGGFTDQTKKNLPKAIVTSIAKETCYVTSKSALQMLVARQMSRHSAHILMKDVRSSAVRKVAHYGRNTAALKMFKTGALASVLGHLAIFLVNEALDCCYDMETEDDSSKKKRTGHLQRHFKAMVYAILLQGAGCAIGTLIKPGKGTFVFGILGSGIAYMIVPSTEPRQAKH